MPGTDLSAIPLPAASDTEQPAQKLSTKEILEKALKQHKSSKQTSSRRENSVLESSVPSSSSPENGSSQRIVDELFQDFISKKMSSKPSSKSSSSHVNESKTSGKSRSSIDEINKLLDMEISSIQAHTPRESNAAGSIGDALLDKKTTKLSSSTKNTSIENPNAVAPIQSKQQSEDIKSIESASSSSMVPLSNQNQSSSALNSKSSLSALAHLSESYTHNQDTHAAEEEDGVSSNAKVIIGPSKTVPIQSSSTHIDQPKIISNSNSLSKKTTGPKQLGFKLSIESLALIQSTDKIDRKGRLWEEGQLI